MTPRSHSWFFVKMSPRISGIPKVLRSEVRDWLKWPKNPRKYYFSEAFLCFWKKASGLCRNFKILKTFKKLTVKIDEASQKALDNGSILYRFPWKFFMIFQNINISYKTMKTSTFWIPRALNLTLKISGSDLTELEA